MSAIAVILSNLLLATGSALLGQSPTTYPSAQSQPQPRTLSGRLSELSADTGQTAAVPRHQLLDNIGLLRGNNTPEARKLGASQLLMIGTPEAISALSDALRGLPWTSERGANPGELSAPAPNRSASGSKGSRYSTGGPLADSAAQLAVCDAVAESTNPPAELVEPLLPLLGERRSTLTESAAVALQRFDPNVVVKRVRPLAADASADIERRLTAVAALGTLGDSLEAVSALSGLLEEPSMTPTLHAAALSAFRQATGEPVDDPESAVSWWKEQSRITQQAWAARRSQQRRSELRKARSELTNLTGRLVVAYREAYLTTPEADRSKKLLEFLTDSQPAVRQLGLDLINAWITDRRVIPQEIRDRLVALLSDPNSAVRLQVTRIVGDLRLAASLTELTRALSQEPDRFVRAAQISAIGKLDDPATTDLLLECLSDDVPAVVGEAVMALARSARRLSAASVQMDPIIGAILDRYQKLTPRQEDVREQFLTAMGLIAQPRFRAIFEKELQTDRPIRIRRAAIVGLAAFADAKACDELLGLLSSPDAEIRLAAAEGLAKCGRRKDELAELSKRVDPNHEPDALVRDAAWSSFLAIATQLPAEDQLLLSEDFDRLGDLASQRRRLDILRRLVTDLRPPGDVSPVKSQTPPFEQLSRSRRIEILTRIADAQRKLNENTSAAASLDQALALIDDHTDAQYLKLALDSFQVRLKAREDEAALDRLADILSGRKEPADSTSGVAPFFDAILAEIRSRSAEAKDGPTSGEVNRLIELSAPIISRATAPRRKEYEALGESFSQIRNRMIDQGLQQLGTDPDVESRILAFSRDCVLLRIHALLSATAATSRPANGLEERWIRLAKKVAPEWPGLAAGAGLAQRESALKGLLDAAKSSKQNAVPAAGTVSPKPPSARNS